MTIQQAIQTNSPQKIRRLIEAGHIVGPQEVGMLLEATAGKPELTSHRERLEEAVKTLQGLKPRSLETLLSLPLNHVENPLGKPMVEMEGAFLALAEKWGEERD